MKGKWYTRAISVTIALSFVLGGLVAAPAVSADVPPTADPNISQWSKQGTPTDDDLVILPGSDIIDMAVGGEDGEIIYAIGVWYDQCEDDQNAWSDESGLQDITPLYQHPKLWKSTDGGVTWSDISDDVLDAENLPSLSGTTSPWTNTDAQDFTFFSNVAVSPADPDFVVVAGWGYDDDATQYVPIVVGSDNGGSDFEYMGSIAPMTSGVANDMFVTALDVSMENDVAVGTLEVDASGIVVDEAAVWLFDGGKFSASWVNWSEDYDGWAPSAVVTDLKFSPNYDIDDTLVALTVSPVDPVGDPVTAYDYLGYMVQMTTTGSVKAWNDEADFPGAYPMLVKHDGNIIVAPQDNGNLGSALAGVHTGEMARRAGHIALPNDFVGYNGADRRVMVAVNGFVFNPANFTSGSDNTGSELNEGGFMFWLMNTSWGPEEMLQHEANPMVASIAYHGDVNMMGRTMVGLMFPQNWGYEDVVAWVDDPDSNSIPVCNGVQVLRSETLDVCCPVWQSACKPPSGQFMATVAYTPDGDMAYAVTQGEGRMWGGVANGSFVWSSGSWSDESAFSVSGHVGTPGDAWNQSGLIDTDITVLADVVVSAGGSADPCATDTPCIYIATLNIGEEWLAEQVDRLMKIGECDSIWRRCATGGWLRIWHKELRGEVQGQSPFDWGDSGIEWMILGLAPEEKTDAKTIYMGEIGTPYVWYSMDTGPACCPAGLGCWTSRNTGLTAGIADIAVLNSTTVYAVDFDKNLRKSTNSARHWTGNKDTKVKPHHVVAWGDWVLVGGSDGKVSYSNNGGDTFTELDDIGDGQVHVAFDSYFPQNNYVYAAVAGPDRGVYRTTIAKGDFKSLDACDELDYWGIVVSAADGNPKTSASTGGVLYASYNGSDDCADSGVARILNPASEPCCGTADWDYLFQNLWEDAVFAAQVNNIAISGDQAGSNATIWAIDLSFYHDWWNWCGEPWDSPLKLTKYTDGDVGRLWKFVDVFANEGPALIGPANNAVIAVDDCIDCVSDQFVLEWDRICDACEYDVQIALDPGFTHMVYSGGGTWPFANSPHVPCDGVLSCEPDRKFYKPSDPCAPSLVVPAGALSVNQDYYWRVRARFAETGEAYRSPWSDVRSFTIAAAGKIGLSSPANGATGVPRENVVFTWSAVSGATSYQFMLWDADGAEVASSTQANTSYVLGQTLDYDSAYMWQVKAMKDGKVINESDMATFRTLVQPVPPPEFPEYPDTIIQWPEPPGTPAWVWVVIALAAILIIVVIVLIFRTRRV